MGIKVIKGNMDYINDCEEALLKSELGKRYFKVEGRGRKSLEEGINKDEIYTAIDGNNSCICIIEDGEFHSFPYIHMICVKSESPVRG